MENRQQRTLKAFENVLIFLDQHPIEPEPPLLKGMKRSLEGSIEKIRRWGTDQGTAVLLRPTHVDQLRRVLRRHRLMPIVRIARPLMRFAPGVEQVLRVPHARADAVTVAEAALEIARVLKPHAKLLASAGLASTFLAELQAEARQLALAAKTTAAARQKQAKATMAIAQEFKKAMQTVTVIEGMVMLHYRHSPPMLQLWRNRRRVGGRVGRPPVRKARQVESAAAAALPPQ